MSLRITPNAMLQQSLQASRGRMQELARLQHQATTGLRLGKPSDDPLAMRTSLVEKGRLARFEVQLNNVQDTRLLLDHRVSELLDANHIVTQAKDLALQARQANTPTEREALAVIAEGLLTRLFGIANANHRSEYLFGGGASAAEPFVVARGRTAADSEEIRYRGAEALGGVLVSPGMALGGEVSGAAVFQPRSRDATLILGDTGLAPGTGTDNGIGKLGLVVGHVATAYAPGSGIAPGTSSPGGDTVIGAAGRHVLALHDTSGDGSAGLVSLNGGAWAPFTSADTDLMVEGPLGERVFVDATTISPGFFGSVSITADGVISSPDAGGAAITIDFTGNQQLLLADHRVINLDTSAITRTGRNHVEFGGTAGAFEVLQDLRDDLRNRRGLAAPEWNEAISRRIDGLDRIQDHILQVIGEQSIKLQHLESLEDKIRDLQLQAVQVISDQESADMPQVATRLMNEQTLLQFVYASTRVVLDSTLLDFLR